jgi:hypothetical protein
MKALFISILLGVIISPAFSQSFDHNGPGRFLKRIEYNSTLTNNYNLDSKGTMERMLFGDFNAPFEFFLAPSFSASIGVRLVKDSTNTSYLLEVKHIPNFLEVRKEVEAKYPPIGVSFSEMSSITPEIRDQMAETNRSMWAKQREEALTLYKVDSRALPVSNLFSEKLYHKMSSFIGNFKAKEVQGLTGEGNMAIISFDGTDATFRTVVDDEVWSLSIENPTGNARRWSNLCQKIITDILAGTFNETNYLKLLDE